MAESKDRQVNVRLYQVEYDDIKDKSKENKISMSDYIRSKVFEKEKEVYREQSEEVYKSVYEEQVRQLKAKDEQIEQLQRLLSQQQQLSLSDKKEKEMLRLELETEKEESSQKVGFWSRFRK